MPHYKHTTLVVCAALMALALTACPPLNTGRPDATKQTTGGTGGPFTVGFHINEGKGKTPAPITDVAAGTAITLPDDSGFSRDGCSFTGWNTQRDGEGEHYEAAASFTPTATLMLYAQWTIHIHEWGNWIVTIAPTFITAGEETGTCIHDATHTTTRTVDPLPITTTVDWTTALSQLNGKTGNYTLTISGNVGVAGFTANSFGTTPTGSLGVTLQGSGKLYLTGRGIMLQIGNNQTVIIDSENLVLEGLTNGQNGATNSNNFTVVRVSGENATLELKNGIISGNQNMVQNDNGNRGGGVYVNSGSFTMNGGEISGNRSTNGNGGDSYGGGVYVNSGSFTMNGGKIAGNQAMANALTFGGGVYVNANATFTMNGGEISGNEISSSVVSNGGGVYVAGTFRSVTGTIYGNETSVAEALRNTANSGAALYITDDSTAQYGTLNGATWNSNGDLSTTDTTIKAVNGQLQ